MSIEEYLNTVHNLLVGFFPLTLSQKDNYLQLISSKINYYKPLIENKSKTALGNIELREYKFLVDDQYFEEGLKNRIIYALKKPFLELARMQHEDKLGLSIVSSHRQDVDSILYVPFGVYAKERIFAGSFSAPQPHLDRVVVHELSHILFSKIEGKRSKKHSKQDPQTEVIWNEGFAIYCSKVFFSNLYPPEIKVDPYLENLGKNYNVGAKKVQKIINLKGKEVLFEIPKRWPEFERTLNKYSL